MGMNFKQLPPTGPLNHKLTQEELSKPPAATFRFEIVADVAVRNKVQAAIGRGMFDPGRGIVEQVDLAINPQQYQVLEPTRQNVTQTISGAWVDYYGLGLPKITMSGTTGWNPSRAAKATSSPGGLLNFARPEILGRIKRLRGLFSKDKPTGLRDFIELRNRIFRTYAILLQKLNIDFSSRIQSQVQLRFYAWDTEDFFIVLMDDFELRRNAARPTLYDYNIRMTVIGYPDAKSDVKDFMDKFYKPKGRLQNLLANFRKWKNNVAKFSAGLQLFAALPSALISGGIGVFDSIINDIEAMTNDVQDALTTPLTFVQDLTTDLRIAGEALNDLEQIPTRFKEDIRNQLIETLCGLYALATYEKLFERPFNGVFDGAPWANLTCSSSLDIPPSPVNTDEGVAFEPPDPPVGANLTEVELETGPVAISALSSSFNPSQETKVQEVVVAEGDTIESLILKTGGLDQDVAQVWQQVATLNNLEYPYLAANADFETEVKATGTVTFNGTPTTNIPAGTIVGTTAISSSGEPITFVTDAPAVIAADGKISVGVTAVKPGAFANIKSLTISQILSNLGSPITIAGVNKVENFSGMLGGKIFKLLKPGQKLKLPVLASTDIQETFVERTNNTEEDLFGNDIFLDKDGDFLADPTGDITAVKGLKNMEAAVIDRLRTDRGELIKHLEYGMNIGRLVGEPGDRNSIVVARLEITATLLQDPRITAVKDMVAIVLKDSTYNVDMNLLLVDGVSRPTQVDF